MKTTVFSIRSAKGKIGADGRQGAGMTKTGKILRGLLLAALLPLLCGIFLVEAVSTMVQVSYFRYTKHRYGEGRRYFLMAPLHHHYQKKGIPENKIVVRFWIVQILLAAMTLVTLKIR